MNPKTGKFVISLDFELYWGMLDSRSIEDYGDNIKGERVVIPMMLNVFRKYGLHATWALVGMATFASLATLKAAFPELKPSYDDPSLSNYGHIESGAVGSDESIDQYHFGNDLVRQIKETPDQEIGSHTFSHYYCLEGGQTAAEFAADLEAQARLFTAESIVFPRNQVKEGYLPLCVAQGFTNYRGTVPHYLYTSRPRHDETLLIRGMRLLDFYVPITGHNTYPLSAVSGGVMANVRASRFLRPYSHSLSFLEALRIRRIKASMAYAAMHNEIFHLWWHPHNFGVDVDKNIQLFIELAEHYRTLKETYGMESATMGEIAELAGRQVRLAYIRDLRRRGQSIDSLPEVLGSPLIVELRRQEAELGRAEVELAGTFGGQHPRMQLLTAERRNLLEKINSEIGRIIANLDNETQIAEVSLHELVADPVNPVPARATSGP